MPYYMSEHPSPNPLKRWLRSMSEDKANWVIALLVFIFVVAALTTTFLDPGLNYCHTDNPLYATRCTISYGLWIAGYMVIMSATILLWGLTFMVAMLRWIEPFRDKYLDLGRLLRWQLIAAAVLTPTALTIGMLNGAILHYFG